MLHKSLNAEKESILIFFKERSRPSAIYEKYFKKRVNQANTRRQLQ